LNSVTDLKGKELEINGLKKQDNFYWVS